MNLEKTIDSIGKQNLLYQDKSIIMTEAKLDTSITVIGKPLSGNVNLNDSAKHFENDDLSIDFTVDKSGLNLAFKASPKPRTIIVHYHQKTTRQNNIVKTEDSQLSVQKKTKLQQDSAYTHIADHQDPSLATNSIKSAIIWVIILLAIVAIGFFVIKRNLFR
ncbi:hypothetical protein [Mucilaginibacter panaciglaebae]|uniref:Uncharacterized protein n=1 Tax=Mucilaginibacter panaciglaebae TaxID=502331 RepID=A0ABP7WP04_9SPHI